MRHGSGELPAANLLITDLGGHTYRLTFQNARSYVAITATGSQPERWTADIRAAIGAPPARRARPYASGSTAPGPGAERG